MNWDEDFFKGLNSGFLKLKDSIVSIAKGVINEDKEKSVSLQFSKKPNDMDINEWTLVSDDVESKEGTKVIIENEKKKNYSFDWKK